VRQPRLLVRSLSARGWESRRRSKRHVRCHGTHGP
jgi:hypothetical protein